MGAIFIAGVLEGRRGFNGLRIMTIISVWFLSWPLLISISAGLMAFCTQTPSLPAARDLGKEATLLTSWLAAGYNSSALALVSIHQALMGRPVVLMCHVAGCNAQLPFFGLLHFRQMKRLAIAAMDCNVQTGCCSSILAAAACPRGSREGRCAPSSKEGLQ